MNFNGYKIFSSEVLYRTADLGIVSRNKVHLVWLKSSDSVFDTLTKTKPSIF